MKIKKLAISVTFHFNMDRIQFLQEITSEFNKFSERVQLHVFTNAFDPESKAIIRSAISESFVGNINVHTPTYLGHPYLLTWSHLSIFKKLIEDKSISHFLYVEDDIKINKKNIDYWLKSRNELKKYNLIPSFIRYEINLADGEKYSTDQIKVYKLNELPRIRDSLSGNLYINLPNPYQGIYLMDREMMIEYFSSKACIPEYSPWGIREKAAAGLTFVNVAKGCYSRNFVLYDDLSNLFQEEVMIHHLPGNYTNNPNSKAGNVKISDLVTM